MWFRYFSCFFLLASIFTFSKSENDDSSYAKHCSYLFPPSIITHSSYDDDSLPSLSTPYFTGGDTLLPLEPGRRYHYMQKNLRLRLLPNFHHTNISSLYNVQAFLYIRLPYSSDDDFHSNYTYGGYYRRRNRSNGSLKFLMTGFWSEKSRKLCMIGSARLRGADRDAVLKLKFADEENPSMNSSVVSGRLESTSVPPYFSPILIFNFPQLSNYKYSLLTKQVFPRQKEESLSLEALEFCSFMRRGMRSLELEYAANCTGSQRCSPLDGGDGYLTRFLSVTSIDCVEGSKKARFTANFLNSSYDYDYNSFDTRLMVIGEAAWDDEGNRMIGVACRLLNPSQKLGEIVVNCTIRLIISKPAVITMRNDAKVVGKLWSSDGQFQLINISSSDERALPEQRYEYNYTEVEKARKACKKKEAKKGYLYPDPQSYDMRFDLNVKDKKGQEVAWASATPVWVGNASYQHGDGWAEVLVAMAPGGAVSYAESTVLADRPLRVQDTPATMTYKIKIQPLYFGNSSNQSISSPPSLAEMEITAEGVYDAANGHLCMVGCRRIVNESFTFKHCDVSMELQLPPLNRRRDSLAKGVIRNTRTGKDPLHFDDLILQSVVYYRGEAERSIWRMDLETVMVLVSNTLACIFLALQIFHLKKNPEAPSSVSLVMLVVLSVGHMLPLVLNFEAVFLGSRDKKTAELGSGGSFEANEVAVRVITMVALLLQLRLFQLVWAAKESSWSEEKKAGFGSLLLYILGGLLTLMINWMRKTYIGWRYTVWGDLRSYAGLILDGFLVPQILLNVVRGSAERALSRSFYIGTSAVRLVPHAYNQYRAHSFSKFDLNATYYYANPAADMYSTAWDIIIPCGVIALAVVVFVQQRHGGRCILPKRLMRGLEMYEKVPTAENQ
ncbi:hypothetical protein SASPL_117890 [Salvia splendens]|uniref:RING-type E3 ubiquitin transferase n=1 Tax=Salvia splendens TaxID=180675 RepID=A0A8X8XYE2_SALSN|nr:uncharacterized protein LOC121808886 [Salvia splendens]KAG6421339.1 hypothetical protein SASPL_117890 [Salvia splendens]